MLITWRDNHYLGFDIFLSNLFPNHIYLLIRITLFLSVISYTSYICVCVYIYVYIYLLNNGTYQKISVFFWLSGNPVWSGF